MELRYQGWPSWSPVPPQVLQELIHFSFVCSFSVTIYCFFVTVRHLAVYYLRNIYYMQIFLYKDNTLHSAYVIKALPYSYISVPYKSAFQFYTIIIIKYFCKSIDFINICTYFSDFCYSSFYFWKLSSIGTTFFIENQTGKSDSIPVYLQRYADHP